MFHEFLDIATFDRTAYNVCSAFMNNIDMVGFHYSIVVVGVSVGPLALQP
jgi:hypothetical protein